MIPALEKIETAIEFESNDKREFITEFINALKKQKLIKSSKNEN